MVLKFKEVKGRYLEASDGSIGSIKDVLFDDQSWKIRYFVIDTGNWLPGQKVLLNPKSFVGASDNIKDPIVINLTKQQIKDAPSLETDKPVSRQNESNLHSYYGWTPYWVGVAGPLAYPYPDASFGSLKGSYTLAHAQWSTLERNRQERFDGHLRSLDEICGYKISTNDEKEFGEISDALIEANDWLVIDLVLNSRKWLPGGKEFVCSPMFVNDIDEKSKLLHLDQKKQTLIDGPDFNFETYGSTFRKQLVRHYYESSASKSRTSLPAYSEQQASM